MDKTVAAAMGSVIALLCVAVVGLAVGWRLAVTRSRKAYKKWGEEVRCRPPIERCCMHLIPIPAVQSALQSLHAVAVVVAQPVLAEK